MTIDGIKLPGGVNRKRTKNVTLMSAVQACSEEMRVLLRPVHRHLPFLGGQISEKR